jgi:uncharacterized membrane protein
MQFGKPIRYLYFEIWRWHEGMRPARNATFTAVAIVAFLFSLNALVIVQILGFFEIGKSLFAIRDVARLFGALCMVVIGLIIWLLFVRNDAY